MFSLFGFEGCANRFKFVFYPLILNVVIAIIVTTLDINANPFIQFGFFVLAFSLITILTCLTFQRLHDLNFPRILYFLTWVPILNLFLYGVLIFKKGTNGPNKYGEDPLGIKTCA